MTSRIITTSYQRLDFLNQNAPAVEWTGPLTSAWESPLPVPAVRTFLRWYGSQLLLVAAPNGVYPITSNGLSGLRAAGMDFFQLYAGYDSDPVLVAENGKLYRWNPDSNPEFFLHSHAARDAVIPVGLPSNQLLLTVKKSNLLRLLPWVAPWTTQLVNGVQPRTRWSDPQFLRTCLPGRSGGIYLNYGLSSPHILYMGLDHQLIWQCELDSPVGEIIGEAGEHLWVRTADGGIACIGTGSGELIGTRTLPNAKNPLCMLDEKGRIVVCNGIGITVIDAFSGAVLSQRNISIGNGRNPSSARGHEVTVTQNDQAIFFDHYNRLFRVPLFGEDRGVCLWEAPERIRGYAVLEDQLIVQLGSTLTGLKSKT